MSEELIVKVEGQIATLVLNRPEKKNSISLNILQALQNFFSALPEAVRIVVIRGAGDEAFSSGFDITTIGSGEPGAEVSLIENAYRMIRECPVPTIAYLNGYAIGAGCDLIVNCDFRIAHPKGKFGMPPAKLGVIYSYDGISRFVRLIGLTNTKELFFTGRTFPADRCLQMGLLTQVVEQAEQERVVYDLAREIAANAPLSVQGIKRMLTLYSRPEILPPEVGKEIQEVIMRVIRSEDLQEGKKSFMEKRKPVFQGR